MALKQNIIYIYFKGKHLVTSKSQYQYNHGQYLYFADLNLPQAFEVHFSNKQRGESKTQIGSNKLVEIPDEYFWSGALEIYAWVYLHSGTDDGETIYEVKIPLIKRAKPTDEEPLPVQQSAIDKAIAELNNAVDITNENADKTEADKNEVSSLKDEVVVLKDEVDSTAIVVNQNMQEAISASERSEASAQNAAEYENSAKNYAQQAGQSAQNAFEHETIAQQKSEIAIDAANEALGYRDETLEARDQTIQAKQDTFGYRDETLSAKNEVQSLKGQIDEIESEIEDIRDTVSEDAQSASQSASQASASAIASAQSAENADESAQSAKTAAQTAQTGAETAAASVQSSAAQIQTNADDISELKEELSEILEDNILFKSASETVTGSGTYVNKNIDITDGIVAGQKYTLKIGSIVGGTSSYLVYLRTLDSNDTVIVNQSSGSVTTNATCSIIATAETAKLRITLYPATTTPMPTGEAIYSNIVLIAGINVEYEISDSIQYDRMNAIEYKADKAVHFVTGKNIFDGHNSNSLADTLVTENGAVTSNSNFRSVFLPIDGGKNIVCNFAYSRYSFYTSYNDISELSVGDTLKGYISGIVPASVGQVVAVPASARYICVGYDKNRIDTMQIEYGTTVTTFEKFYKGVPEAEIIPLKPTVISVYADGTGDYANLRLALESITDSAYNKPYEVHIYEGTYDIASLFTAEEIAQQSNQGLFVPNYVTLVGVGNRDDIKLICTLSTSNQYFSPLHFRNHGGMKNITVDATKCRYVVHDDIAVNGLGSERLVENCKFIGHSLHYACVYGSGMKEDSHWTFKDCVFDASEAGASNASGIAFLSHNSLDWVKPSELTIKNCRMVNTPTEDSPNSYAMRFRTLNQSSGHSANNMPIYIHLYGNLCNGIELREDESGSYGTGILTYVDGFYNKNAYEHITTAGAEIPTSDRFNLI